MDLLAHMDTALIATLTTAAVALVGSVLTTRHNRRVLAVARGKQEAATKTAEANQAEALNAQRESVLQAIGIQREWYEDRLQEQHREIVELRGVVDANQLRITALKNDHDQTLAHNQAQHDLTLAEIRGQHNECLGHLRVQSALLQSLERQLTMLLSMDRS